MRRNERMVEGDEYLIDWMGKKKRKRKKENYICKIINKEEEKKTPN